MNEAIIVTFTCDVCGVVWQCFTHVDAWQEWARAFMAEHRDGYPGCACATFTGSSSADTP